VTPIGARLLSTPGEPVAEHCGVYEE
jgi:hypothetical protein